MIVFDQNIPAVCNEVMMPRRAPIAFFDNSLSYGSSGDEELVELTANIDQASASMYILIFSISIYDFWRIGELY